MGKKINDEEKAIIVEEVTPIKQKKRLYLSYTGRIIIYSLIFILLVIVSFIFFNESIDIQDAKKVNYQEKSKMDYKVKVKSNDFYKTEYLDKDMSYIASLIDKINVTYNYDFDSDMELYGKFTYKILGTLEILNSENNALVFSEDYELLNDKVVTLNGNTACNIKHDLSIDYAEYNNLANEFKTQYGTELISNLKVYFVIDRVIDNEEFANKEMDGSSKMLLSIPLSEKMLSIKLDYNDINEKDTIFANKYFGLKDVKLLCAGCIILLIALIYFVKLIKLISGASMRKTTYDKYVKKILREYDRLIVNSASMPDLYDYEVTQVKSFEELLDAKDNLLKPICFYELVPHNKCYFYVKSDGELYLYIVKDVDLQNR